MSLGEIRITSGCSLCGAGHDRSMCAKEFGPEFDYASQVGCNSCKIGGFLVGSKSRCRRIAFNGDPRACCLTGASLRFRTCDPRYTEDRFRSTACEQAFRSACVGGGTILTDPNCKQWAAQNPAAAEQNVAAYCSDKVSADTNCRNWVRNNRRYANGIMSAYCNSVDRMNEPVCREWVTTDPARNPDGYGGAGKADNLMNIFCDQRPNDPLCTCIKSSSRRFGNKYNPLCVDANCATSGYATAPMLAGRPCPPITDCSQIIELRAGGDINFTDNVLDQRCGPATPTPVPAPSPSSQPSPTQQTTILPNQPDLSGVGAQQSQGIIASFSALSPTTKIIIILVFLLLISIAVGMIAYGLIYQKKSNVTSGGSKIDRDDIGKIMDEILPSGSRTSPNT